MLTAFGLPLLQAPAQGEVRELRGEVRGLKEAAQIGPRTAVSIANRQARTFDRQLAEFQGSLDKKLDEKLAPLVAEQRRQGSRRDAVFLTATILASGFTLGVAVWGLLVQR